MFKSNVFAIVVGATLVQQPASAHVDNLVANGDFESGNVAFVSDYLFVTQNTWEGEYGINSDPRAFNQNYFPDIVDHTNGTGNMMLINGSPQVGAVVWSQTVPVVQNSPYVMSTWVRTLYPTSVANLRFTVNGGQIGSNFSPPLSTSSWAEFSATWNSGGDGSALIQIVDLNTDWSGNDFALDDLSFRGEVVPEPSAALLLALLAGCATLVWARHRQL